jgi:hypothetical protein
VADDGGNDLPMKKRRLVNGKELIFRKLGQGSEGEDDDLENASDDEKDSTSPPPPPPPSGLTAEALEHPQVREEPKLIIHED